MTRHVSEDGLTKLALGLLSIQADQRVRRHLEGCSPCRVLLGDIERTLRQMQDVSPQVSADIPVLPFAKHSRYRWLRVAAMLAVGFGLGFLASESLRSPSPSVVRQQFVPRPPAQPAAGFVFCDEIDLTWSAE